MRHIKTYKIFEAVSAPDVNDNIIDYINDVLESIKDDGFRVSINYSFDPKYQNRQMKRNEVTVIYRISREITGYILSDVKPSLLHIISYLNEEMENRLTNLSLIEEISIYKKDHRGGIDYTDWENITKDFEITLDRYSDNMKINAIHLKFRLFV